MKHFPYHGMRDEEIIDFFKQPLVDMFFSPLEGNRLFEVIMRSSSEEILSIGSNITDIDEYDEICLLSFERKKHRNFEKMINVPVFDNRIQSLHKIIGEFGDNQTCECGLMLESSSGIMTIVSGAFPASLNVMYSGYDQKLNVNSFQTFKYYTKTLIWY